MMTFPLKLMNKKSIKYIFFKLTGVLYLNIMLILIAEN